MLLQLCQQRITERIKQKQTMRYPLPGRSTDKQRSRKIIRNKQRTEIPKQLKRQGLTIKNIATATGLSEEEIKQIKINKAKLVQKQTQQKSKKALTLVTPNPKAMTTVKIREKVISIIDHADDRILKAIYATLKEYEKAEATESLLTEDQKKEIDRRWEKHKSGKSKSYTIDEVNKYVKARLKK